MIVDCRLDELLDLIGKKLSLEELEETLFLMKAEIERADGNQIQIEINPDRQDMLSAEGIARAVRAFLDIEPGLKRYRVKKSGRKIIVKRGLKKVRRYISCGIAKNVEISDDLIKDYMQLQDQLTSTHGRNRKKASIGLYVYDDIEFPIRYCVRKPEKISFAPLGTQEVMDARKILNEHEKGVEFGAIISEFKKWPLLIDAKDEVLSLPPIINSNTLGRITEGTSNIFVEVTGTHLPTVNQALNIMVTALVQRKGSVELVTVEYPDGDVMETPELKPLKASVAKRDVVSLLGLDLTNEELVRSLARAGHDGRASGSNIAVKSPAYRTDLLHDVDIIEDISIGYGYNNIESTMPETMTVGTLLPATWLKKKVCDIMIGMEYQEVLSYIMTSPAVLNEKTLRDEEIVVTTNPRSRDYSVLRNALFPVLLDFISKNQHADLPQRVYEVGDIVIPDSTRETMVEQVPSVCGLVTDVRVNLTDVMTDVVFLMANLGLEEEFKFRASEDATFIPGRSADIVVNGKDLGVFGEVSPDVLSNFELLNPVVGFELKLPRMGIWDE
ncbi:phenylalanine--tRNA ligase subunit beta [Candidatus Thorarchaeota archaeon]|nr:MAG: phenylalanine--tRNA ligase subunit beta [Candidatus Thorarchaeota archaeon]